MKPTQAAELGAKVRARRRACGLTIVELADRSGYDRTTVQRLETGAGTHWQTAVDVCQVLGMGVEITQPATADCAP